MNREKLRVVLNSTVIQLGLISFFADVASEMLYPITPIFLTSVLGASMANVGFIEGVSEAISSVLRVSSGRWSDRIKKRKPFVIVGYLLSALAKPLTGFASNWPEVLFARGFDRVGKGLRTAPRDALLSESVPTEFRGAAFGWHRFMDTLGAAVGPLVALVFLSTHADDLRSVFLWAFIPSFFAILVSFLITENPVPSQVSETVSARLSWSGLSLPFKQYLGAWFLFSLGNSSDVFLLMKAKEAGHSLQQVVLLYCFFNLVYAFASPYLGNLSDRLGRKVVVAGGLFLFSLVYLGFAVVTSAWMFWILFGVYGLYMAACDGNGKALAIDLSKGANRATNLGLVGTTTGIATIISSTTAGYLWDQFGSQWAFYLGAAGALIAATLLMKVRIEKPA